MFTFNYKLTVGNILAIVVMLTSLTLAWGKLSERISIHETKLEEVSKKAEFIVQIREDLATIKSKLDMLLEDLKRRKNGK